MTQNQHDPDGGQTPERCPRWDLDGRGRSTLTVIEEERHHTRDDTDCGPQQQDDATQAKQWCRRRFFLLLWSYQNMPKRVWRALAEDGKNRDTQE
jgi:hypothetical protein